MVVGSISTKVLTFVFLSRSVSGLACWKLDCNVPRRAQSTLLSTNRYTHSHRSTYYALCTHEQTHTCPKWNPALSIQQWNWMHLYMYRYLRILTWVPTNLILGNNDLAWEGVFGVRDRMIHNADTANNLSEKGCQYLTCSIFTLLYIMHLDDAHI